MIDANLVLYVCELLLCCVQTPLYTRSWLCERTIDSFGDAFLCCLLPGAVISGLVCVHECGWRLPFSGLFWPTSGFYY